MPLIMEISANCDDPLTGPARKGDANLISAIIPARNEEATIARAVESVAAQPEGGEIIVVNDQSIDQTGAILADLAARIPKLRILNTHELPAGWTGKNHAASLGAAVARGEWLLFTDADTYHLPGSAGRALASAAEHDAALISFSPEQENGKLLGAVGNSRGVLAAFSALFL